MAMQSSDSALANWLISQYEMSKHLCDRLKYPDPPDSADSRNLDHHLRGEPRNARA
jgi:hypothetical protein